MHAADPPVPSKPGAVQYCHSIRRNALRKNDPGQDLFRPLNYLTYLRSLGAGGAQLRLGVLPADDIAALRQFAEVEHLFLEAICSLPLDDTGTEQFEAEVQTAVAAGAAAIRTTLIPGRRYEAFDSLQAFHESDARGRRALHRAVPIVERHRIPLAVENHKDHRDQERVLMFEQISSEFVGACLDTGNSFALLEDPLDTAKRLAPWTHSVHLKDQAVRSCPEGFLLGDIPLGQGCLPLAEIVTVIRNHKPQMRFCLELITRDPLLVPVLEDSYWRTFPDVPAEQLARTLRIVRDHPADNLQYVSKLSLAEQQRLEESNVQQSLEFARKQLDL